MSDLAVVTVRGPIDPSELGVTLAHDHVVFDGWDITQSYSSILDDENLAAAEVRRFKQAGGSAICEPTSIDLGRNPEALRRISAATGVHIVMGTGWYLEAVYPPYIREELPDRLAERLVQDLAVGVGGTGIRAGFIGEIGTGRGHVTPAEERVFRAAARAHRRTGCPIMTHTTHFGELALEQIDLLAEEGVTADRIIVSHLGDRRGIRSILPIAERGVWLSVDNLGWVSGYSPLEVRADNVAALWAAGYGERVLLSTDICSTEQLAANGGVGYDHVLVRFRPLLAERGIDDQRFWTMARANPALAFAYPA